MRSSHSLARLAIAFDDDRGVVDAGFLLPAILARHLGLRELVDEHVNLGRALAGPPAGRTRATRATLATSSSRS